MTQPDKLTRKQKEECALKAQIEWLDNALANTVRENKALKFALDVLGESMLRHDCSNKDN